ncbi:hypothetical protein [Paenibacillus camerounensis]|uniref:hypothetical protein n=1 Tax=Paenibacillus camerounensis TaxID=1243663 RepID=UPI0005A63288|nr:hypothetical protein [Paenibacillus camerounensis]
MAFVLDESAWPLVTINLGDQFDRETVNEYIAYWEKLLAGNSRFGLIMIQKGERGERPDREVTRLYMDWCKSHKGLIARSCAGIAVVTASSKLLALYKPVTALSTKKVYGCPGNVFAEEAEAQEWLGTLLQKN